MTNRTLIINELQTVAPGLIPVPAAMPYTLPPAYFDNFASSMLHLVQSEEHFPVLASISHTMPYETPAGYFDTFSQEVLQKIKPKEQQTVPQGYFETLPHVLLAKVRQLEVEKELEEFAPLLNTINKQPVQFVPDGYFENLSNFKAEKTAVLPAPVISINQKTSWIKYAAAASIAVLLSFGGYKYFSKNAEGNQIVKVPASNVNVDQQLASMDAATIEHYLQENESITESSTDIFETIQDDGIDEMLQYFSDQQLKEYLEENSALPSVKNQKKI